mmetsp:Transcript_15376/g.37233  ORF Transcript_15376/g.37233 Transcript_15376/m.37233 type:complete len:223 (-) Transcript_15376:1661-2329(-)
MSHRPQPRGWRRPVRSRRRRSGCTSAHPSWLAAALVGCHVPRRGPPQPRRTGVPGRGSRRRWCTRRKSTARPPAPPETQRQFSQGPCAAERCRRTHAGSTIPSRVFRWLPHMPPSSPGHWPVPARPARTASLRTLAGEWSRRSTCRGRQWWRCCRGHLPKERRGSAEERSAPCFVRAPDWRQRRGRRGACSQPPPCALPSPSAPSAPELQESPEISGWAAAA